MAAQNDGCQVSPTLKAGTRQERAGKGGRENLGGSYHFQADLKHNFSIETISESQILTKNE